MTAVLGNMTPDPSNAEGVAAVNALAESMKAMVEGQAKLTDALANLSKGRGSKGGGGGPPDEGARIEKMYASLSQRIEKSFAAFGATGKSSVSVLAKYQLEMNKLNNLFTQITGKGLTATPAFKMLKDMLGVSSAQTAARTGPKPGVSPLDNLESKLLAQFADKPTLRNWRQRNKLAASADTDTKDHFIEQEARQRLSDHRKKQAESLEKLEAKWLQKEREGRENYQAKLAADNAKMDSEARLQASSAFKALHAARERNADKAVIDELELQAQSYELAHNATYTLNKKREKDAKSLAEENSKFDREGLHTAQNAMALYRATKEKQKDKDVIDELKLQESAREQAHTATYNLEKKREKQANQAADTLKNFQEDMIAKATAGMSLTKGDLKRAIRLNSPDVGAIRASLQADADAKAAKKEADEKAKEGKKQGFFGGFARNNIIGLMYQAIGPVMAPLSKFTTGVMEPALNALKALGDQVHQQGRGLAYNTGMAEALGGSTYGARASAGAMLQSNAMQEINTAVSSKMVAGINESAGRLADGASTMFTNALVSPLTGFKTIVDQIGGAVGMFNPGIMSRFNIMFRDLTATIGSGLAPVMNLITDLMRTFGDYLQPVIAEALPRFKELMGDLYRTLAPMIPTLVQAIKEMIDQFGGGLKKFAVAGDKGAFVKNAILEATGLPNPKQMMNQAMGALSGAAVGAAIGSVVPVVGTMVGGLVGGLAGSIAGRNWEGNGGVAQARAQNAAQLQRGNITGMAAATDARFQSGMDIAKQAAQTAFLASSSAGMSQGNDIDMELKKQQLQWFKKANGEQDVKPAAVNGNVQAGVAGGGGEAIPAANKSPARRYTGKAD